MSGTNTFTRDGVSIRFQVDGREGAPWIVFSNSICTDLSLWEGQAAALAPNFRVLRYDQRGHGGSSVPSAPCTFEQLGGDVAALLDHLGIARCTFVGLSMGVPTGLQLYKDQPQRIERLVLCDGQAATAPAGAGTSPLGFVGGVANGSQSMVKKWFGAGDDAAAVHVFEPEQPIPTDVPLPPRRSASLDAPGAQASAETRATSSTQ